VRPTILLVFEWVAMTTVLCCSRGCVVLWMTVVPDVGVYAIFKVVDGSDECGDIRWLLSYCSGRVSTCGVWSVGVIDRVGVELL